MRTHGGSNRILSADAGLRRTAYPMGLSAQRTWRESGARYTSASASNDPQEGHGGAEEGSSGLVRSLATVVGRKLGVSDRLARVRAPLDLQDEVLVYRSQHEDVDQLRSLLEELRDVLLRHQLHLDGDVLRHGLAVYDLHGVLDAEGAHLVRLLGDGGVHLSALDCL